MATKTKTELKTTIATNILTSQLMTDIVDSFSQGPDSNGNYAMGGSLPSDVYDSGSVIAYAENVFYIAQSNGNTFLTKNLYLTNSNTWKITGSGTVGFSVTQIGAGSTIEYHGEGTGGDVVTLSSFETKRTDKNGNVSHNGTTIPTTLDPNFSYVFDGNSCKMKIRATGPSTLGDHTCNNCYFNGASWVSIANTSNFCSYHSLTPTTFAIKQSTVIATSAGQPMAMTTVITPS